MPKSILSIVITCITIGWFLGVSTVIILVLSQNQIKPNPALVKPVVCLVELKSGPIGTHKLQGVQK